MTETPDRWVMLKISSQEYGTQYKVLAGWYGGYGGSDYWKLSSGTIAVEIDSDGNYLLPQVSGTVYRLSNRNRGFTNLTASMYDSFKESILSITEVTLDEVVFQ